MVTVRFLFGAELIFPVRRLKSTAWPAQENAEELKERKLLQR